MQGLRTPRVDRIPQGTMRRTRRWEPKAPLVFLCGIVLVAAAVFQAAKAIPPSVSSVEVSNTSAVANTTEKTIGGAMLGGVDASNPRLIETIDTQGDSSNATVLGMATGYPIQIYKRFVGSLRKSGYTGHIILGISPDAPTSVRQYLESRGVTMKEVSFGTCSYPMIMKKGGQKGESLCAAQYPDIKLRWSRYALARDWLEECSSCTGPVLLTDVRDTMFQLDPFGKGSPPIRGLHVFEEHKNQTTQHWLTEWPLRVCKGMSYSETMLCSGTTIGTRAAMLAYLNIMDAEMKVWIENPQCRFGPNGDDHAIHNYLFYSGKLAFAHAIENRHGGHVHTVGVDGARAWNAHVQRMAQERPGIKRTYRIGQILKQPHLLTHSRQLPVFHTRIPQPRSGSERPAR